MNAVLVSIQPKYCELIINGKKTLEVRKTRPKIETSFKCYIYCTKDNYELVIDCLKQVSRNTLNFGMSNKIAPDKDLGYYGLNGKIIGEFVCDRIDEYHTEFYAEDDVYQEIRRVWLDPDYDYPYEDFEIIASNDAENLDNNQFLKDSNLSLDELKKYAGFGWGRVFAWHISDLKIYDNPKSLSSFRKRCNLNEYKCKMCKHCYDNEDYYGRHYATHSLERPPQSWCYIED